MRLIRQSLRDLAFRVAPATAARLRRRRRVKNARRLGMRLERAVTLDEKVDLTLNSTFFAANQKRAEILALLQLLQEVKPTRLCEIGTAAGGTLALFCQVAASDARILSVDIGYRPEQIAANSRLARRRQQVTCLAADSHATELSMMSRIGSLGQAGLPLHRRRSLFRWRVERLCDVRASGPDRRRCHRLPRHRARLQDSPWHRDGRRRRRGPQVWAHLKKEARTFELVEDPDQDGMGIGVVRLSGVEDPRED